MVMLAAIAVATVLVVGGLVMAVVHVFQGREVAPPPAAASTAANPAPLSRDEIAAAPMASLDPQAAFTPDPAIVPADTIRVPVATAAPGPDEDGEGGEDTAMVPSGFPQTPEGAVGQLAAIEQTVLESMSLDAARQVHTAWVLPGGPSVEEWELTRDVQAFLASARQGGTEKDLTTLVSATPMAGMVKGSDGPTWTVACVLMDVQAAIRTESRMGYGLCSRMQWDAGRWKVAPGAPPAQAPSAWPGSRAAAEAGWLTWVDDDKER